VFRGSGAGTSSASAPLARHTGPRQPPSGRVSGTASKTFCERAAGMCGQGEAGLGTYTQIARPTRRNSGVVDRSSGFVSCQGMMMMYRPKLHMRYLNVAINIARTKFPACIRFKSSFTLFLRLAQYRSFALPSHRASGSSCFQPIWLMEKHRSDFDKAPSPETPDMRIAGNLIVSEMDSTCAQPVFELHV